MFEKKTADRTYPEAAQALPVVVEPREGFSDEDLVAALQQAGAKSVSVLSPGMISALATSDCLRKVEKLASVHLKDPGEIHPKDLL